MTRSLLLAYLLALPSIGSAQEVATTASAESVVRALMDAGNRSDLEGWLALFDPQARQFQRSESDHALADRPSTKVRDSASRRAFYDEVFSRPQKTHGEIVEMISLGELVMSRGIFHRPEGPLHTLTVYRVRGGKILDIWDVEQVAEARGAQCLEMQNPCSPANPTSATAIEERR